MLPPLQGCRILVTDYLGLRSQARFSPGYNIVGLQPSESAYDLSHLGKVFDRFPTKASGGLIAKHDSPTLPGAE